MDVELVFASLAPLLNGALVTLILVSLAVVFGTILSIPIAIGRLSSNPAICMPAYLYVLFFRGTPLLVQMFLIYFGLGQFEFIRASPAWLILREPWWCAIISLTLGTASYMAEILRGAILGVPREEIDAGRALGLSRLLCFRLVVLPRAIRLAISAYGNEIIMLLKGSAVVSTITIIDLTGAANFIYYRTYDPFTPFIMAGAIYLFFGFTIVRLIGWIEYKLSGHLRA